MWFGTISGCELAAPVARMQRRLPGIKLRRWRAEHSEGRGRARAAHRDRPSGPRDADADWHRACCSERVRGELHRRRRSRGVVSHWWYAVGRRMAAGTWCETCSCSPVSGGETSSRAEERRGLTGLRLVSSARASAKGTHSRQW